MSENEIIKLWKQGLSKNRIAKIYQRNYNQQIKIIRLELINRYWGHFINIKEALYVIEKIIYKYIKENK